MRFSYIEAMTDPAYYAPLAEAAEEAGYDGFVIGRALLGDPLSAEALMASIIEEEPMPRFFEVLSIPLPRESAAEPPSDDLLPGPLSSQAPERGSDEFGI